MEIAKPNVYIIDDDESVCDSIRYLVESVNLQVRSWTSTEQFLQESGVNMHGCILLDIRMPHMSGLDLQMALKKKLIDLPIIFITAHADVPIVLKAMKQGALDIVSKPFNHQLLLDLILKAINIDQARFKNRILFKKVQNIMRTLTHREKQIMQEVRNDLTNKAIARKLSLSEKTVERHRASCMRKLDVHSQIQFIRLTDKYYEMLNKYA